MRRFAVSIWLAAAFTAGCHRQPAAKAPAQETGMASGPSNPSNPQPIGTAAMAADGTITLDLHSPDGAEGRLVYPPSHRQYDAIKRHLPDLRPGGSVLVAPWPN